MISHPYIASKRMFARVFQHRLRRYRPVGSDSERSGDFEFVCASNLSVAALRERRGVDLLIG